jgi:hypothetical protein
MRAMRDAIAWLRSLPAAIEPQRAAIEAFLATARRDDRIRVLVVGCSIGRGVADPLSDIDALIGVRPDSWPSTLADSRGWVESAGPVIDLHQLLLPDVAPAAGQYQHTYAQYANGVELDLVVSRAGDDWRRRADWVVLYDPDEHVPKEVTRSTQNPDDVRRWGYAALTRLSAVAKYATRGALWEAHQCLELARADVWRMWALAEGVADAQYGVTAVFDDPRRPVPPAMARTVASLEAAALVAAASVCCDLVTATWPRAMAALGAPVDPPALAAHVRTRLRSVPT